MIYLALLSAVAYGLWSVLLKYNPVSRVTIYAFMTPVMGVLLSALMLGEGGTGISSAQYGSTGACMHRYLSGEFCRAQMPENRMTGKGFLNKINCKYGWNEEKRKEGYH